MNRMRTPTDYELGRDEGARAYHEWVMECVMLDPEAQEPGKDEPRNPYSENNEPEFARGWQDGFNEEKEDGRD